MFRLEPSAQALDGGILQAFEGLGTSTLGHLRDWGFPRGLQPSQRPLWFAGCAVTVRIPHMDSTAVHVAVDMLRPGDVLVVEQSGDDTRSCFGGVVSYACHVRGAVGAVLDGCLNDIDDIQASGFPVYSRGVSSLTTRILGLEGSINCPVSVGGVVIRPGDLILGDSDGIAVIGADEAEHLAAKMREKENAEGPRLEALKEGAELASISRARKLFEEGKVCD